MVHVDEDHVRRTFSAHTNMTWEDFGGRVQKQFDRPRDKVHLGFCISGDARVMSDLACESDWDRALARVKEKILAARTRAVTMEIKDMVSCAYLDRRKKHSPFGSDRRK
jgi:hypothetical protein